MVETKDVIDALSDGDNLGAEKAFKDTISKKVADSLETKRKEVANSFVKSSETQKDKIMDAKPSDFLNTFEKTIKQISKKHRVREKGLMDYFEREVLTI